MSLRLSLLGVVLLLSAVVAQWEPQLPPGLPPAPKCAPDGSCAFGQYCALLHGERCCLSATCYPPCPLLTHYCEWRAIWYCGPHRCDCPHWHVCIERSIPLKKT